MSYNDFRSHTFIQSIAGKEKWTVSDNTKMPIDMFLFETKKIIAGALYKDRLSLVTLDKLHELIPNAANHAFYLSAMEEGFAVLDIEPKCPKEIREKLEKLSCSYAEISLSGKGMHMIIPFPAKYFHDHPILESKVRLKEEHGWYELLLDHYVTFTGNIVSTNGTEPFDEFLAEMIKNKKEVTKSDVDVEYREDIDVPNKETILYLITKQERPSDCYKRTPDDFHGDMSRYEFGYISFLYNKLIRVLSTRIMKDAKYNYTDSDKAWFLWKAASELIPKRPKHDQSRNKMPWLMFVASEVIAKTDAEKKGDGK